MNDCNNCEYAEFDYEEYYGTNRRQYFVSGCKKDAEYFDNGCSNYKEIEDAQMWGD